MKTIVYRVTTMSNYILYLSISLIFSLLLTPIAIFFSKKFIFLGRKSGGRHIHQGKIPRLGGVVLFLVFWALVLLCREQACLFPTGIILDKHIIGLFIASLFLIIVSVIDDVKEISWKWQLSAQIASVLIIIASGIGVPHLTNPFGGVISMSQINFTLFNIGDIAYKLTLPADIFTLIWVILFINTINWLDGLDGLASGVGVIGSFALFFLSLTPVVNQPQIATLSIVLVGTLLGFLVYNFSPAKIFLGTGGSTFLGLMLAALAIISGGKVATALLILGFPILDAFWVIIQRWRAGVSIINPDKRHFHHKLLEIGFSQRKIVLFIYCITVVFGVVGVVGQSKGKSIALIVLLILMIGLVLMMTKLTEKNKFP